MTRTIALHRSTFRSLIIFCGEPIEKRKQLLRQLLRGTGQKLSNVDYERVSPDR
jgi:hypothetical protein